MVTAKASKAASQNSKEFRNVNYNVKRIMTQRNSLSKASSGKSNRIGKNLCTKWSRTDRHTNGVITISLTRIRGENQVVYTYILGIV